MAYPNTHRCYRQGDRFVPPAAVAEPWSTDMEAWTQARPVGRPRPVMAALIRGECRGSSFRKPGQVVEMFFHHYRQSMATVAEVRALARTLPRSSEHLIRDRVKFRVGSIVYVAFSRDETTMGFAYPREDRDALIAGEPDLFFLPEPSDLRFNWLCCHLARLDPEYMTELVTEAWRMVVPKFLARQRLGS